MSFSRRKILGLVPVAAAVTLLDGCGFSPVYGPGGAASGLRGSIAVASPENRDAFLFVARLEDRLGQPEAARFMLVYTLATSEEGVGITPSQETTRYNLLGRADFTVTDKASGTEVQRGFVENFTGYSATGSITGTLSATQDARERLMLALADQLVTKLIATAPSWSA